MVLTKKSYLIQNSIRWRATYNVLIKIIVIIRIIAIIHNI